MDLPSTIADALPAVEAQAAPVARRSLLPLARSGARPSIELERLGVALALLGRLTPAHAVTAALLQAATLEVNLACPDECQRILLCMPALPFERLQQVASWGGDHFAEAILAHPNAGPIAAWAPWFATPLTGDTRMAFANARLRLAMVAARVPEAYDQPSILTAIEDAVDFALRHDRRADPHFFASVLTVAPLDRFRDFFAQLAGSRRSVGAVAATLPTLEPARRALLTPADLQPLLKADAPEVRLAGAQGLADLPTLALVRRPHRPMLPRRVPRAPRGPVVAATLPR